MAAASTVGDSSKDILPWLKSMPLAPEYHPTLAEFQDPVAYILKIEEEASKYGICKIVPPLPASPKRVAISNLNRSLAARNPEKQPTFTTRQQQIGFCPRRHRPVQRPVWQSGESYTLQQFEAKAKQFEKAHLKKCGRKGLSALEMESSFWKAIADKPFMVEYANDMPGSAFSEVGEVAEPAAATVGDTEWNMRVASRAKGSLLRFMKEEIAGVTSPMVYLGMMFSWFAWHVEDHDLHSLNYLHMGAGKTWYGVPRDAGIAFEEVVRVQGYGGEVNPAVTFAILGEKTTVMSPEVLLGAGIPCCRLVQNAGEFVITFPGAYHSGFSHGFNCGEAANIATPEWLRVAKEATIRRASINYPPMVSYVQLLYEFARTLCSRVPMSVDDEPRSSRLKDKKRDEGEMMIKKLFVQNVMENNNLLHILLEKGSSCVLLPYDSSEISLCSNSGLGSQILLKPRPPLDLCSQQEASGSSLNENAVLDRNMHFRYSNGLCQGKRIPSVQYGHYASDDLYTSTSDSHKLEYEKESISQVDRLLDQGLFPCVTCGVLSFACAAIIQPREAAARYLMSADCNIFSDQTVGFEVTSDQPYDINDMSTKYSNLDTHSGWIEKDDKGGLYDIHVQAAEYATQPQEGSLVLASNTIAQGSTSLDLLAHVYGDSSDSDEEMIQHPEMSAFSDGHDSEGFKIVSIEETDVPSFGRDCQHRAVGVLSHPSSAPAMGEEAYLNISSVKDRCPRSIGCSPGNVFENVESVKSQGLASTSRKPMLTPGRMITSRIKDFALAGDKESDNGCQTYISNSAATRKFTKMTEFGDVDNSLKKANTSFFQRSDKDSSRMHIFCLEHALEVQKKLRPIGGVGILLLCHADYPELEAQAKSLVKELEIKYHWKDVPFREPTNDDKEKIRSALDDEEVIPGNGDWAVKMGINLYHSADLSKSPLYSKQMPYNVVLYKAFGCNSSGNSPTKPGVLARRPGRQKKIVVAGRWCGKVWMSNQVHPYLAMGECLEQEHVSSPHYQEMDRKLEVETAIRQVEKSMPPEGNLLMSTIADARIPGKKRTKSFEYVNTEKSICPKVENTLEIVEGSPKNPSLLSRRIEKPIENGDSKKPKYSEAGNTIEIMEASPMNPSPLSKRTGKPFKNVDSTKSKYPVVENTPEIVEGLLEHPSLLSRTIEKAFDNVESEKPKYPEVENTLEFVEGVSENLSLLSKRTLRSSRKDDKTVVNCSNSKEETEGGPSTRLRRRPCTLKEVETKPKEKVKPVGERHGKVKKVNKASSNSEVTVKDKEAEYHCDVDGCTVGFSTKQELMLHKQNICSVKGCGKKLFSHKYLVQHQRVHDEDRPLKCPWNGCKMTFKWAWARTEHIRVHTGARPYVCHEAGCGKTFRFVSDFSRHKRKTGHSVKGEA